MTRSEEGDRPHRRKLLVGGMGALICAGGGVPLAGAALRGAAADRGLTVDTRVGMAFQTPVAFTLVGDRRATVDRAMTAAFAGVRAVEQASSVYRSDGELARLNREGVLRDPSRHLLTQMRYALDLASRTDGAFDPTVQPLWDIWAGAHAQGRRPSDAELAVTLRRVDWRGVTVTDALIAFDRPGMAVTLNSINQGYASDVVMAALARHGIADAFVDTGEFAATGRQQEGRDWRLGVVAPRANDELAFVIDPFRRFAATSGDYKTFFSPDFRDHHIFDPKTGRSPPDWSSITVSAPTGLIADGLSTALFALDAAAGRRLLASEPACAARLFDKSGAEYKTSVV